MAEVEELANCFKFKLNKDHMTNAPTGQILKQVQDDEKPRETFALFLNFSLLNCNLPNNIQTPCSEL